MAEIYFRLKKIKFTSVLYMHVNIYSLHVIHNIDYI